MIAFEELVAARNKGDGLVHAVRKTVKEAGDKVQADEKERIESAIKALEESLKGDDVAAIEAASEKLTDASAALAQRLYSEQAQAAGAEAPQQPGQADDGDAPKRDDIVDAEFEEVRDGDRK